MDPKLVLIAAGALWWACRAAPGSPGLDHDITAGDMRARISFLASDQLQGRGTPSRGLNLAAEYIRSEFRRIGLDSPPSGHIQRYRLAMSEMGGKWSLALTLGSRRAVFGYRSDFWGLPWAGGTIEGRAIFVGDRPPEIVDGHDGEVWIARLDAGVMPRAWLNAATDGGAAGLVFVVPERDEVTSPVYDWLTEAETILELGDLQPSFPAVLVGQDALVGAFDRLGLAVEPDDLSALNSVSRPRVRLAADLRVEMLEAPNVMGILRGSDERLRDEYVLISAHMDHLGIGAALDGDSIYNGADDNASGTAALLEVAEAAAALKRRPKRSLIFLTVSGEERGLLGSSWFVQHPPVPLDRIVAGINIDMVGRNWEDTIAVIGKPYSSLGALIDSVAVAHPELRMTVVDDPWPTERFFFRSDHINFARKGIPSVFFFNGVHEDYHRPSDEANKIKFGKAARVSRLVLETVLALANAEQPPRWNPQVRERIVEDGY
jgi:hypothetical protein